MLALIVLAVAVAVVTDTAGPSSTEEVQTAASGDPANGDLQRNLGRGSGRGGRARAQQGAEPTPAPADGGVAVDPSTPGQDPSPGLDQGAASGADGTPEGGVSGAPPVGQSPPGGGGAPTPSVVDPASIPAPIGYVGGSLTYNATDGYESVGGTKFWEGPDRAYGGGTVTAWAFAVPESDVDDRWTAFADLESTNRSPAATRVVWFELLSHGRESDDVVYDAALTVLGEIRRRVPAVTIYVSGMNGYTVPASCSGVTADAPQQMRELAARLVAEGRALAGPIMAELTPDQANDGAGCHANSVGKRILGEQLRGFFG